MFAVVDTAPGGPEVLKLTDQPAPELTPDGVRIKVAAAGINRADVLQRTGNYKIPDGASRIFGLEVAGTVVEVGPEAEAQQYALGTEVCALLDSGGYATEVVSPAANVLPKPANVTLEQAACLPEVLATVWSNIFMEAAACEGEAILIHGGSGGVGTAAIQVCKARGLRVLTTVSSAAKAEFVQRLGAEPIRYDSEEFDDRVRTLTGGHGADVILDVVGAKYLEKNLTALAHDGRLVVIGLQGGRMAELDMARLMGRRLHLMGTTLRARPAAQKAEIMRQVKQYLWPLVERGEIVPVLDKTFPLADAAQAHAYFDSGSHVGKVLLIPGA